MTKMKKRAEGVASGIATAFSSVLHNGSGFELRRLGGRTVLSMEGILAVRHLTDERICLATHGGAVTVNGTGLTLLIFEQRSVKIYGRVISVELGYGRT